MLLGELVVPASGSSRVRFLVASIHVVGLAAGMRLLCSHSMVSGDQVAVSTALRVWPIVLYCECLLVVREMFVGRRQSVNYN